jgi:predicted nucleotidyltransferase
MAMNVMNKDMVLKVLRENKNTISNCGIKRIGLFGSYVKNEQKSGSDIDFLVEFDKGKKNYRNFLGISELMEKLFDKKVDIVTDESLSPYIGPYIRKEVEYV